MIWMIWRISQTIAARTITGTVSPTVIVEAPALCICDRVREVLRPMAFAAMSPNSEPTIIAVIKKGLIPLPSASPQLATATNHTPPIPKNPQMHPAICSGLDCVLRASHSSRLIFGLKASLPKYACRRPELQRRHYATVTNGEIPRVHALVRAAGRVHFTL